MLLSVAVCGLCQVVFGCTFSLSWSDCWCRGNLASIACCVQSGRASGFFYLIVSFGWFESAMATAAVEWGGDTCSAWSWQSDGYHVGGMEGELMQRITVSSQHQYDCSTETKEYQRIAFCAEVQSLHHIGVRKSQLGGEDGKICRRMKGSCESWMGPAHDLAICWFVLLQGRLKRR